VTEGAPATKEGPLRRHGFRVAAALFVVAYAVLLSDPGARIEALPWFATTAASLALVLVDERRLPAARRAEAFPASGALHAVAFLQIAVAVHFLRTRWKDGPARAFVAAGAATVISSLPEMLLAPSEPGEGVLDWVVGLAVLALLPLPIALLWRGLAWLDARVDVQRGAVRLGVGILGGATLACLAALAFV